LYTGKEKTRLLIAQTNGLLRCGCFVTWVTSWFADLLWVLLNKRCWRNQAGRID